MEMQGALGYGLPILVLYYSVMNHAFLINLFQLEKVGHCENGQSINKIYK